MPPRNSSSPERRRPTSPATELGADGRWTVTPSDTADFTTRIVVLTPTDRSPVQRDGARRVAQCQRRHRRARGVDDGPSRDAARGLRLRRGVRATSRRRGRRQSHGPGHVAEKPESTTVFAPAAIPATPTPTTSSPRPGDLSEMFVSELHVGRPHRAGRVAVGAVPDDLHQRRRPARPGLRRLPGALAIRAGRPVGRRFDIRRAGEPHIAGGQVSPRSTRPARHDHHRNRPRRRPAAGLPRRETA